MLQFDLHLSKKQSKILTYFHPSKLFSFWNASYPVNFSPFFFPDISSTFRCCLLSVTWELKGKWIAIRCLLLSSFLTHILSWRYIHIHMWVHVSVYCIYHLISSFLLKKRPQQSCWSAQLKLSWPRTAVDFLCSIQLCIALCFETHFLSLIPFIQTFYIDIILQQIKGTYCHHCMLIVISSSACSDDTAGLPSYYGWSMKARNKREACCDFPCLCIKLHICIYNVERGATVLCKHSISAAFSTKVVCARSQGVWHTWGQNGDSGPYLYACPCTADTCEETELSNMQLLERKFNNVYRKEFTIGRHMLINM